MGLVQPDGLSLIPEIHMVERELTPESYLLTSIHLPGNVHRVWAGVRGGVRVHTLKHNFKKMKIEG